MSLCEHSPLNPVDSKSPPPKNDTPSVRTSEKIKKEQGCVHSGTFSLREGGGEMDEPTHRAIGHQRHKEKTGVRPLRHI